MTFIPLSQLFAVGRGADAPVANCGDDAIGFARFSRDVASNAALLQAMACQRGLLLASDSYWGAVGMMALLHAGATVILPQSLHSPEPDAVQADCVVTDEVPPVGQHAVKAHRLKSGEHAPGRLGALNPMGAKLELYTAGSTGEAKRVAKTLADMENEAAEIHKAFGASLRPATVFATVPYHHLYGLTFRLVWPLCAGWRMMRPTFQYWEELARAMGKDAVLVTSPAHLTRLPDFELPAERHPQLILSAGAVLSNQAAREAASALGGPITDIFGSTETGVIAYRRRSSGPVSWQPFPGVALRQLADGRLAVQASHISAGTTNGWFETADLVEAHTDGTFDLRGRADQILKIEGNRVSLAEIERLLTASPLVEDAAVVPLGADAAVLGAAIVLSPEGRRSLGEIGAFRLGRRLRHELARQHEPAGLPRRWRFPDRLPEAILGKRKRSEVVALFDEVDAPTEPEVRKLRVAENDVEMELFLSETLLPLRGHFPDLPVVPGVALVNWAVRYARKHLGAPDDAGRAFQIKFRRVTTAPSLVTLTLARQPDLNRIQFEYRQGDTVLSIGALNLRAQV